METLDFSIPEFYHRIAVAAKTLLTYPVSTCAAERSLKRLKPPLRSAVSDASLSSLSVIHIFHKHKEIDLNEVISIFAGRKDRRLALYLIVTVNRYIPFVFMKAKVTIVILIYSASVFLLLAM